MSDTTVQECNCCKIETDCIDGLCEMCSDYNYKLQKQVDLLVLGLLKEKRRVSKLQHEYDTTRGLWCIDCNPKSVDIDWIRKNSFQLQETKNADEDSFKNSPSW